MTHPWSMGLPSGMVCGGIGGGGPPWWGGPGWGCICGGGAAAGMPWWWWWGGPPFQPGSSRGASGPRGPGAPPGNAAAQARFTAGAGARGALPGPLLRPMGIA
ncbi:hypothetical protein JTE90_006449 [Oedothorax gibbosus]|uniref:Uncharacterized protein n=1 Tax=Oedothorax gibbosus TaxID=931172 RepID=A0AAV6UFJ6_9ARAC|nr:hypothetical protein JTE90_006449 [Oedothorax gibbosus]